MLTASNWPRVGQLDEARKVLHKALAVGPVTWQLQSRMGTVLDRLGRHAQAQEYYGNALKASPNNASITNNLGMSHALSGKPQRAEKILRAALPKAEGTSAGQMRQNLALVLGLQGKFGQVEKVLSKELPPHLVEQNMAYIKKMISQPNLPGSRSSKATRRPPLKRRRAKARLPKVGIGFGKKDTPKQRAKALERIRTIATRFSCRLSPPGRQPAFVIASPRLGQTPGAMSCDQ